MKLARRQLFGLGAAGLAGALLSGCESLEQKMTRPTLPAEILPPTALLTPPTLRLLNRMAYGPRPGDMGWVTRMGREAYVEEQLSPETIAEEATLTWRLRGLGDTLDADSGTLFDMDDRRVVETLRQAALLRAVYSRRQLFERTVEFWTDHFNIYAFKGEGPQLIVGDDRNTIRAHAFGKFRDLLGASARSAAMLGYLDNASNQRGVANENYARELMELHTLGVDGGYTQRDVQEVARCLTGWTAARHWHRGQFVFDAARHDDGAKHVLGVTLPAGGGVRDGERVLDILAGHPATARHLARKLCHHFVGEAPESLVNQMAATYQQTRGDIRAVLHTLLLAPEILSGPPILKRPFDYAVSALRAFDADTDGGPGLQAHLERMGQPLFAWPMPDGFPERASAWTGALIPRWNFALGLAGGQINNTLVDWAALAHAGREAGLDAHDTLTELALGVAAHSPALPDLRRAKASHPSGPEFGALLLMSPQFQWR